MASKKIDLGHVLVIGGCGFLGHHVVNLLVRSYAGAVSVVDLTCTRNRRPDSDGVNYYEADITDADKLLSIFQKAKPDTVIHTASPQAEGENKVAHALFKKVNVDGTKAVVEACQKTGVKALVYTSSASVISDNVSDLINADERWPVIRGKLQSNYYSETKVCTSPLSILHIFLPSRKKFLTNLPVSPGRSRRIRPRRQQSRRFQPLHSRDPPLRHHG